MSVTSANPVPAGQDVSVGSIAPFIFLTFGMTWGVVVVLMVFPEAVERVLGPLSVTNPLYILGVWAPGLVAFALILRRFGRAGLWRFLRRLIPVGASTKWWAFVLLGLPLLKILGAILNGTPVSGLLNVSPFGEMLAITVFMLFLGPVEEFGWRGYLLPLLQRIMAPVWAALIVGVLWAVWHIPAFYLGGAPHSAWAMAPFILGVTSVGIILGVVYNRTNGNLLFAILIHWQLNIAFWPDAQPWENYLMFALALVLLWVHRKMMFSRDNALTEVVPA